MFSIYFAASSKYCVSIWILELTASSLSTRLGDFLYPENTLLAKENGFDQEGDDDEKLEDFEDASEEVVGDESSGFGGADIKVGGANVGMVLDTNPQRDDTYP